MLTREGGALPVDQNHLSETGAVGTSQDVSTAPSDPFTSGFVTFYESEISSVFRLLVFMGATRSEAEDAAQEAMVDVFQRWSEIKAPKPYVRKAATHLFLRSRRRDSARSKREIAGHDDRHSVLISDDAFAEVVEKSLILTALNTLPPVQRMVFALTIDGWSPTEIAVHLEMNPATVRSTLRSARNQLRQELARHQSEPGDTMSIDPDVGDSGRHVSIPRQQTPVHDQLASRGASPAKTT